MLQLVDIISNKAFDFPYFVMSSTSLLPLPLSLFSSSYFLPPTSIVSLFNHTIANFRLEDISERFKEILHPHVIDAFTH